MKDEEMYNYFSECGKIEYVRLSMLEFLQNGQKSIHGYLKKLCGEDGYFFQ